MNQHPLSWSSQKSEADIGSATLGFFFLHTGCGKGGGFLDITLRKDPCHLLKNSCYFPWFKGNLSLLDRLLFFPTGLTQMEEPPLTYAEPVLEEATKCPCWPRAPRLLVERFWRPQLHQIEERAGRDRMEGMGLEGNLACPNFHTRTCKSIAFGWLFGLPA